MEFLLSVNHPNIIQLYDAFNFNNLYYYVLEKADGSLRDLVENHPQGKMTFSQVAIVHLTEHALHHRRFVRYVYIDVLYHDLSLKQLGRPLITGNRSSK